MVASGAAAFPDGAPPAHTGGHGEPSCHVCHFDGPVADGGARIEGLPPRYTPGDRYRLELIVDLQAALAGFQVAVRDDEGGVGGRLEPADATTRAVEHDGVTYIGHTAADRTRWAFVWTAPMSGDDVTIDFSVNAANGDRSEFGDRIVVGGVRVEADG